VPFVGINHLSAKHTLKLATKHFVGNSHLLVANLHSVAVRDFLITVTVSRKTVGSFVHRRDGLKRNQQQQKYHCSLHCHYIILCSSITMRQRLQADQTHTHTCMGWTGVVTAAVSASGIEHRIVIT